MLFRTLLFDLDGTLTDPYLGITECVRYALRQYGIEREGKDLLSFIGPPLTVSFQREFGFSPKQAEEAAAQYRVRFEDVGWRENRLIDGVVEMLKTLQARGVRLIVATTKPQVFAERILSYFGIDSYFYAVVGAKRDGSGGEKSVIVARALEDAIGCAAMIGDRRYDVEGAKANGLYAVGVRFGYAEKGELETAGADYIADTVADLAAFLYGNTPLPDAETAEKLGGIR